MGGKRVGILAPMVHEIEPFVRDLGMDEEGDHHIGMVDDTEIVAMVTNMGIQAGADAARRILQHDVDHVMVVGIAGGVDHSLQIGQVVVPERVLDRATGRMFTPIHVGDIVPRGTISCGDDLITDPATIAQWESEGVVAVEMETTGVAPVCEDAGVAWSVFRGISDFADGGLVDDAAVRDDEPRRDLRSRGDAAVSRREPREDEGARAARARHAPRHRRRCGGRHPRLRHALTPGGTVVACSTTSASSVRT